MISYRECDKHGNLVHWYELGEARCPLCGCTVLAHFQHGVLIGMEECTSCRVKAMLKTIARSKSYRYYFGPQKLSKCRSNGKLRHRGR